MVVAGRATLDLMPNGNLAVEIGDCEAVLILTPKHARKLATNIRTALAGDGAMRDLLAERDRINAAITFQRRKWQHDRALAALNLRPEPARAQPYAT